MPRALNASEDKEVLSIGEHTVGHMKSVMKGKGSNFGSTLPTFLHIHFGRSAICTLQMAAGAARNLMIGSSHSNHLRFRVRIRVQKLVIPI